MSLDDFEELLADKPADDRVGEVWSGVQMLDGLEATLDLPAIGVAAPLAEIDRDVIGTSGERA